MEPGLADLQESAFRREMRSIMNGDQPFPRSSARRHHFVPAFSLAQFADPRGSRKGWIFQLDVRSGKPQRTRPDDTAYAKDLYAYEDDDGEVSLRVEAFFSLVEKHAAPALARLREAPEELTPQDRETIAYFLVLQESRTPTGLLRNERLRQATLEIQAGIDLSSLSGFREAFKSDIVDSLSLDEAEAMRRRMQQQLFEGQIGYEAPTTGALAQIVGGANDVAKEVYSLDWVVLTATDEEFITSDRPISMIDHTPRHPWSGNAWKSSPGAINFYPLSPTKGLFMTPGDDCGFSLGESDNEHVRRLNLMTYGWADHFIYGRTQEVVSRVRKQARRYRQEVAKRRPPTCTLLLPADRFDKSVTAEYERRGWPRGFEVTNDDGERVLMSYIVVDLDEAAGTAARAATKAASYLTTSDQRATSE